MNIYERESVEQTALRLGFPIEWVKRHYGDHVCVNGIRYHEPCMVFDVRFSSEVRKMLKYSNKDFVESEIR